MPYATPLIFAHGVEGEAPAEPSPRFRFRLGGSPALQVTAMRKNL